MAGDPYWYDNVGLLLPMTGVNNSTNFVDLERIPKTITPNGVSKIITTTADPFSQNNGVGSFASSYATIAAAPLSGTTDFCIEAWIMLLNTNAGYMYSQYNSTTNNAQRMQCNISTGGSTFRIGDNAIAVADVPDITQNQWVHVAFDRKSGVLKIFNGGVEVYSHATLFSGSLAAVTPAINAFYTSAWQVGTASLLMSNLRVTNQSRYRSGFTPPVAALPDYNASISGTLTESLVATDFVVEAHQASDGVLSGREVFTGSSFTIDIKTPEKAHYLTIKPDMGVPWKPSTAYALDAKVFPTNPTTTPYYYKRIAAGTSDAATEPTWNTAPGGQCDDGAVPNAWERVERLAQPITHGPLIPTT